MPLDFIISVYSILLSFLALLLDKKIPVPPPVYDDTFTNIVFFSFPPS